MGLNPAEGLNRIPSPVNCARRVFQKWPNFPKSSKFEVIKFSPFNSAKLVVAEMKTGDVSDSCEWESLKSSDRIILNGNHLEITQALNEKKVEQFSD